MGEELRITGDLPGVQVEILHRQFAEQGAEQVTITLTTRPNLAGADSVLTALANPWMAWAALSQAWLAPWSSLIGLANPWSGLLPGNTPFRR